MKKMVVLVLAIAGMSCTQVLVSSEVFASGATIIKEHPLISGTALTLALVTVTGVYLYFRKNRQKTTPVACSEKKDAIPKAKVRQVLEEGQIAAPSKFTRIVDDSCKLSEEELELRTTFRKAQARKKVYVRNLSNRAFEYEERPCDVDRRMMSMPCTLSAQNDSFMLSKFHFLQLYAMDGGMSFRLSLEKPNVYTIFPCDGGLRVSDFLTCLSTIIHEQFLDDNAAREQFLDDNAARSESERHNTLVITNVSGQKLKILVDWPSKREEVEPSALFLDNSTTRIFKKTPGRFLRVFSAKAGPDAAIQLDLGNCKPFNIFEHRGRLRLFDLELKKCTDFGD